MLDAAAIMRPALEQCMHQPGKAVRLTQVALLLLQHAWRMGMHFMQLLLCLFWFCISGCEPMILVIHSYMQGGIEQVVALPPWLPPNGCQWAGQQRNVIDTDSMQCGHHTCCR
jgi:hypothetical protein